MRWTRGPPDQGPNTCFKSHLSELSQPLISWVITAKITYDRWTLQHIAIVGLRSNGWSSEATFQIKTRVLTWAFDRWSDGCDLIAPFRSNDASSRSLIAMHLFIERLGPISPLNNVIFATERIALELSRNSNCPDTNSSVNLISSCSWLVSASKECLKSRFDRDIEGKSHLELQFCLRKWGIKSHASGD